MWFVGRGASTSLLAPHRGKGQKRMRIRATRANPTSRRRLLVLCALCGVAFFVTSTMAASLRAQQTQGTPITVNTDADEENTDGDCSLREATIAANTNQPVDACAAGSSTEEDAIGFDSGTGPLSL